MTVNTVNEENRTIMDTTELIQEEQAQLLDPAKVKDRLVVTTAVYHQPFREQPVSVASRFVRELETNEQAFVRRRVIDEEWQLLDCGWINRVASYLLLVNEEGKHRQTIPTPEELADTAERVIEVSHNKLEAHWLILPGASMQGTPVNLHHLFLRCCKGTARLSIFLVPY